MAYKNVSVSVTYETSPERDQFTAWFWRLLKRELAPYPGRASVVARMVISATLVMIAIMTFHIPGAGLGAYYTLTIPRDSPRSALKAALISIAAFALGTVYVVFGVMLFLDSPVTHFLWVVASLFLVFYVLSVTSVYNAATGFGFLIAIAIPLWDRAGPTGSVQLKLSATLFTFLSVAVGCALAVVVEYIADFLTHSGDRILAGVSNRLQTVENLLSCYEQGEKPADLVVSRLEQYATIGTGSLRQLLGQARYDQAYLGQLGAVVALSGRLTDLAAVMTENRVAPDSEDKARMRALRQRISELRVHLLRQQAPEALAIQPMVAASSLVPLLPELERCVMLISQAFAGTPVDQHLPSAGEGKAAPLFARDAFSNPKHLQFAFRGCLASSACYIFYTGVDWPGINTSVATCILTAFSTIGASRQKQLLRVAGTLIGGVVFGLGTQVFVLPNLDSITGFMVLFAFVSGIAAWITTASPRLAYAGLQLALAYYLINLNDFAFNTSLAVARDRIVGVLVGLIAMWLIFDQIGAKPAALEMKRIFLSNLRRVAAFGRRPSHLLSQKQIQQLWSERNAINKSFSDVRAQADAVIFEFRDARSDDLAARQHVRAWQPELRTIFLTKIALVIDRFREPLSPLVEEVMDHTSALIAAAAEYIEGSPAEVVDRFQPNSDRLLQELDQLLADQSQTTQHALQPLILAHSLLLLTTSFVHNIRVENVPLAHSRTRLQFAPGV